MYDDFDFDDDMFLAPEALVALHFDGDDSGIGYADAMERDECAAWSRPACRSNRLDEPENAALSDDESAEVMRAARRILAL